MKKIALALAAVFATMAVGLFGCAQQDDCIDIYLPDGAPALALGLPMYEDKQDDRVEYHVVSSQTIKAYVTGNQPEAEICVLPVNLAAKLLGSGEEYKMAGVVTHGNMYLLSKDKTQYTRQNAADLIGKTVGVVQLNNVPGLTLKAVLNDLKIPFNDLSGGGNLDETAVNLKPVDAKEVTGADVFLLPSPAADVRAANTDFAFVGDLQALYGGEYGYPQAVVVVKNDVLQNEGEFVAEFLQKLQANADWLRTAEKGKIVQAIGGNLAEGLSPTFNESTLTDVAIAHSGIRFQEMNASAITEVEEFLARLMAIAPSMAAMPNQSFYYLAK